MHYVLGRQPDEFGLVPDQKGFVRIKDLLKAISEEPGWGYVRRSHIHEVLMTSPDNPFIIEDERIKAATRHNAASRAAGVVPPKLLYHCVRRKAYPVVCRKGIIPMGAHQVFLATTAEMALRIGRRRDPKPVLLTVQAQRAFEEGVTFSKQGERIYVVDHVPLGFFSGPPLTKEKEETSKPEKKPVSRSETLPGSFTLNMQRSQELQRQQLKTKGRKKTIAWKKDARKLRRKHKGS